MLAKRSLLFILIPFTLVVIDSIFKFLILKSPIFLQNNYFSPIAINLHKNPGIAFDILIPIWIIITITSIIISLLIFNVQKYWKSNRNLSISLIFIIFGATGNMIDRIINGFTTDYIMLFSTSIINISDILIIIGVLFLLWYNKHIDGTTN